MKWPIRIKVDYEDQKITDTKLNNPKELKNLFEKLRRKFE